jgi:hypothetical protein
MVIKRYKDTFSFEANL